MLRSPDPREHPPGARRRGRSPAPARIGALYYSYQDVATEKERVNGQLSSSVIPQWNACADNATDTTGQQLSADFSAWYASWQAFTQSGTEGYTFQPDDAEWSTLQQYETQLAALVSRINAYCGSSIPNVAPAAPATNVARLTYVALAVVALGFVAVIGAELAPELGLVTRKLGG